MTLVIVIYVILLLVFFGFSALIVKHVIKHGYLSPSFRLVAFVFGIASVCVIGLSIYFLLQLSGTGTTVSLPGTPSTSPGINF